MWIGILLLDIDDSATPLKQLFAHEFVVAAADLLLKYSWIRFNPEHCAIRQTVKSIRDVGGFARISYCRWPMLSAGKSLDARDPSISPSGTLQLDAII